MEQCELYRFSVNDYAKQVTLPIHYIDLYHITGFRFLKLIQNYFAILWSALVTVVWLEYSWLMILYNRVSARELF